jgi:hypothetical protein
MTRTVLLIALALCGCNKPNPQIASTEPAVPTDPAHQGIDADMPEYATMLADLKADPKSTKYARKSLTLVMKVESVKELSKVEYLVKGKGKDINLACVFQLPPTLEVNNRIRNVEPGDTLTYTTFNNDYKPGPPPTLSSGSGGFMGLEKVKK